MTDLEYRLIKEAVKQVVLQEMKSSEMRKRDSFLKEVRKKQHVIFDEYFPGLYQTDAGRYWRTKEAITKLTNLCRFRMSYGSAWDASINSEVEAESAINTYTEICALAAKLIG